MDHINGRFILEVLLLVQDTQWQFDLQKEEMNYVYDASWWNTEFNY